jgi:hypothetical protein
MQLTLIESVNGLNLRTNAKKHTEIGSGANEMDLIKSYQPDCVKFNFMFIMI